MKLFSSFIVIAIVLKVGFYNFIKVSASMSTSKGKTVRDHGYDFNADGKLRQIDRNTGELSDDQFHFDISSEHAVNQQHYEQLGEAITEHVYDLLEKEGFHRIYIPDNIPKDRATFIFSTQRDIPWTRKLMVLIHGSGVVRAGQWARSLIINHSLDHGTQLPYIKLAKKRGYDILVLNTNDNFRLEHGIRVQIPGSETPIDHAVTVWKQYVMSADPEAVAVIAHSYGGVLTIELAKRFPDFFKEKVFAIGFTDSVHFMHGVPPDVRDHLISIGRNWVTSHKPLDIRADRLDDDIPRFSAGHTKHEWTSYSCMPALFKFLDEKHSEFTSKPKSKKQKVDL